MFRHSRLKHTGMTGSGYIDDVMFQYLRNPDYTSFHPGDSPGYKRRHRMPAEAGMTRK